MAEAERTGIGGAELRPTLGEETKWVLKDNAVIEVVDVDGQRQIVDADGNVLLKMHASEVVKQRVYNTSKSAVVLLLFFKGKPVVGPGSVSVGYDYSRLVRAIRVGKRVEFRNALIHYHPFMKKGSKGIREVLSVSEDGQSVTAVVGENTDGNRTVYSERKLSLLYPRYLD